ncbi:MULTISPECIES: hypothetical protein [unclassified Rhodococcus (in: high G+C Gram-positive bacteria)]|uniref:hypothetical protein n=1 Tax=unclassified Rhodococcus (in: high G+C Gram-positive bacteria) TaxID=192944 RepID=UPI001AE76709|nr:MULTISPECIES: hypothetical protein [unclassified Rhodococcus (in: high G+C Gram-positive bacteria)]MBP2524285.1 hypothetical protein [Rhodococcus sp. PvP104]MDA3637434.1 hypothetical protein [Rhodococcus sp. C-2]
MAKVYYGGETYTLSGGVDAVEKLEQDISEILQGGGAGAFVGFRTPSGTVRVLVSNSTPIALKGATSGNPEIVVGW